MVNCVNTVSDISTMGKNFTYYPDKEIYMISGVYAYILDKNFVKTSCFGYGIYYRKADDTYLRVIEKEVYSFHLYTYDELVKMADKKINGYKPSERIIRRYNITVK